MKPANFAPVYLGLYTPLAELCRAHGYALAPHGSLGRDFDLIAIPWTEEAADPETVVDAITSKFSLRRLDVEVEKKPHGRLCYPLGVSFGDCYVDLQFMPRILGPL